ncbi:MAG TPA: hypothetical protein VK390_03140, partial [Propionibacteriaceae bacterium]|nr:hypothetical protein [Propionibacteriaceae bacterium]
MSNKTALISRLVDGETYVIVAHLRRALSGTNLRNVRRTEADAVDDGRHGHMPDSGPRRVRAEAPMIALHNRLALRGRGIQKSKQAAAGGVHVRAHGVGRGIAVIGAQRIQDGAVLG